MRKVIFHYHFFKNAGTSVDVLLKTNFPEQWTTKEFSPNHLVNASQIKDWIQQDQNALAFSSHTAMLPFPEFSDIEVFPIFFIRHPIDRIASAYAFERFQGINGIETGGAILASQTTLAGYIEEHLKHGNFSQCRNFHLFKLKDMCEGNIGDKTALIINALDNSPFVGLVEEYEKSIHRLIKWLSPHFPQIKPIAVVKNATRNNTLPLEQKLGQIRSEVGPDCYAKLLEANAEDMAIYNAVQKRYA